MAKTKISEFSATANSNTDINSINIAEGCAPSNINDAIRELMAELKDFQAGTKGDSFNGPVGTSTAAAGAFTTLSSTGNTTLGDASGDTVTINGTTTFANVNPTLSAGTANGVLYLNGSKVATSGSALTFDGTVLANKNNITALSGTNSSDIYFAVGNSVSGSNSGFFGWRYNSGSPYVYLEPYAQGIPARLGGSEIQFQIANGEQMRLTSTGLGIGTSSPTNALTVGTTSAGKNIAIYSSSNGNNGLLRMFDLGGTERLQLSANSTGEAVYYAPTGSVHAWYVNTERMRLDSSGNLGLGVTPSAWASTFKALQIGAGLSLYDNGIGSGTFLGANYYYNGTNNIYKNTAAATAYSQSAGVHAWYNAPSGTAGNTISFTQAMTLDASGNLGVGITNPAAYGGIVSSIAGISLHANSTSGAAGLNLYENGTGRFSLRTLNGSAGLSFYDTFNGAERARITSGGYFKASNTGSYRGSTATYNEFYQTADNSGLAITCTNTSQTTNCLRVFAARNTTNNSYYAIDYYNDGADVVRFRVADSGNVTNTNNSYGAISDIKLKENITDATPKLAGLMQVRVRNYNLKSDPTQKQLGVIAQELEQVFPGMVEESPDRDADGNDLGTTTKQVKYSVFVPMLIKAMQEQQAIIEQLKADVAALKGA